MNLRLNKEKCIGCYACQTACLDAHFQADDPDALRYRSIQRITYKDGFIKYISPGCTHCGACIKACEVRAIYRDKMTGFVLVESDRCTGCRRCEKVCKEQVIQFDHLGKMQKCDGCIERIREGREPACVRVCSVQAIEYKGRRYDN
ncbi:4Fe-4S dicluster domain-containing protein [Lachnospiraceae bacterium LCP25S3_G4]